MDEQDSNQNGARRETVSVDQLLLWQNNPRIDNASGQNSAMKEIYSSTSKSELTSHKQMLKLSTSIAEHKYDDKAYPIITIAKTDDQQHATSTYTVVDGNRRLTAIRFLTNPKKYKGILTTKSYKELEALHSRYRANIPSTLEIVVYPYKTKQDKNNLRNILRTKHGGALGGAGTVEWSAENKNKFERQNFQSRQPFYEKLEPTFKKFYGKTLTEYLGGSVTTTRRLFNSRPIENYLGYKPSHDDNYDMGQVKKVADTILGYKNTHNQIPLSRLNNTQIKSILRTIPKSEEIPRKTISDNKRNNEKTVSRATTSKPNVSRNQEQEKQLELYHYYVEHPAGPEDNRLGSQWYDAGMLSRDKPYFSLLNEMLVALNRYGDISGKDADLHAVIFAPAIRVLFELAVDGVKQSGTFNFTTNEVQEQVASLEMKWKSKDGIKFITYVTKMGYLSHINFKSLYTDIKNTKFEETMGKSNLTSHRSKEFLLLTDVKIMFNNAVLFAELCEQYVNYLSSNHAKGI